MSFPRCYLLSGKYRASCKGAQREIPDKKFRSLSNGNTKVASLDLFMRIFL